MGTGHQGYFHWKYDIAAFISKHWKCLLGNTKRQKKSWLGTVSGILSHNSPHIFLSGTQILNDAGWWKLTQDWKPKQILDNYYASQVHKTAPNSKRRSSAKTKVLKDNLSTEESNIESLKLSTRRKSTSIYSKAYVKPADTLSDSLFSYDADNDNPDNFEIDIDIESGNPLNATKGFSDFILSTDHIRQYPSLPPSLTSEPPSFESSAESSNDTSASGRALLVHTNQANTAEAQSESDAEGSRSESEAESEMSETYLAPDPPPESLFTKKSDPPQNSKPSMTVTPTDSTNKTRKCVLMSQFEEIQLLNKLRPMATSPNLPPEAKRLYRKLHVRNLKRRRGMPLFDLDEKDISSQFKRRATTTCGEVRHLDRFQRVSSLRYSSTQPVSFMIRLMGQNEPTPFYSPYTQRILKPFVRRDYSTNPLWLKLMDEIQAKTHRNDPHWKPPTRWPIDFCYARPHHIASVNELCCEYFYPGVDLSECLTYPDFSCIALYKKLVIGFGFMLPDVGNNEAYISFLFTRPLWRNAGIGSFILYHLIQTCMGKDVTLHVSVTNPALLLYQKFGFKVEEFVQDFYDKYFSVDSTECKHALFLRLRR